MTAVLIAAFVLALAGLAAAYAAEVESARLMSVVASMRHRHDGPVENPHRT